jgi:membrane protease YdiL (CAAX protease family)
LPEILRQTVPLLCAALFVLGFERAARRRGLEPPGFRQPARRLIGLGGLALGLAITVFAPLGAVGAPTPELADFAAVRPWQLFAVHLVLLASTIVWYSSGYAGSGARWTTQLGFGGRRPGSELALGVAVGIAAWLVVLAATFLIASLVTAVGGDGLVPDRPPAAVVWLVSQGVLLRIGLAVSAGVFEEVFFRGLLQPRVGLLASTGLFALAHLSYGQPFMLVGITCLSLLYGLLVRWRQSLWAAVAAHALFDLVQLLVVVPSVLERFGGFFPEGP